MPDTIDKKDVREHLETDVLQQVTNAVEDTILFYAPDTWSDERCKQVEDTILSHTRTVISALTTDELRSPGALHDHIVKAASETKRLIHGWR